MQKDNPLIQNLIQQFHEIHHGKPWMGPTYDRHLQGINDHNAFIRPLPSLHSIAEIISHLTTWREETILKIKTGTGSKTDQDESNWFPNEVLQAKGWTNILNAYQISLNELIQLLQEKDDTFLEQMYYDTDFKGDYPYSFVLNGMLHHDIYHLGQIGIIIKYLKEENHYMVSE